MTSRSGLEQALDYQFIDPGLLALALTHRSAGRKNNERLEFLGDSVVNHLIAEELYRRFPKAHEGQMSRMRAALVNGDTLADIARELQLGDYLRLGVGERKSGGYRRDSILADALEAVFGAMLLDRGIDGCRQCVQRLYASRLDRLRADASGKDAKTRLQEYLQGRGHPLPEYDLLAVNGEGHAQQFTVSCRVDDPALCAQGEGSSRRRAEQAAAGKILRELGTDGR